MGIKQICLQSYFHVFFRLTKALDNILNGFVIDPDEKRKQLRSYWMRRG